MNNIDHQKWEEVKKIVDQRDKRSCQFIKCLFIPEFHQLKKEYPSQIDRCHIFASGSHPEQTYNPKNIITLNRTYHKRMDEYRNPVTGDSCDLKEHWYWWWRIYKKQPYKYNENTDYEYLLKAEIMGI